VPVARALAAETVAAAGTDPNAHVYKLLIPTSVAALRAQILRQVLLESRLHSSMGGVAGLVLGPTAQFRNELANRSRTRFHNALQSVS
jgi:hypothetical protein